MNRWTKRPQNACRRCNYTWYPRGKHVSHSCPRCGSREVELASAALFRAIGEMVVALFLVCKVLIVALAALVVWVVRRVSGWVRGARAWFASRAASRRVSPAAPLGGSHPRLPPPATLPSGKRSAAPGWMARTWSRTRDSFARFVAWVASVNDDLTGVNDNPHPLGIIAKLLVILVFAGAVFAVALILCRALRLL